MDAMAGGNNGRDETSNMGIAAKNSSWKFIAMLLVMI
jgi:hypothetical protein